ncbi:MAG TPA: alpha/beta hydrolase [Flavisolibacter sp.]|nr:alpha/beta hydrolase [Flavisolibacter sp.]
MQQKSKGHWVRRVVRILIGFVLFFITICLVLDHFVQFRMHDAELLSFFSSENLPVRIRYYEAEGRKMRYISVGDESLPALVFIHGSPSSLSIYKNYYKDSLFQNTFHILAVDRPGYGYSGFGDKEPSIQKQAQMIKPILDTLHTLQKPVLISSGSYGTSIACRLVMDNPGMVDGMVLVAPSLAPGEERLFWFTHAVESPLVNWFIPRMLQVANAEKVHHQEELEKMLPYWSSINIPIIYIQGEKDELIDTSNASFARKQLVNVPFLEINMVKGRKHFLAFDEHQLISRKILELYRRVKAAPSPKTS